ncbi:unnamed protein product [Lactuca saligna]|uniref:Transposase (putative) gypsy type domain-containing protein n=1 Tax=Lactuca saligna TaxID=75948 RepID=A0AA35Y9V7_LACSI|nr:unnamed protein product [Lactuca saligna]
MENLPSILPSAAEYQQLETTYGISPLGGMEFPSHGSFISSPPPGKIGIYQKTLDAGVRLPLTDFQEEVLQKEGCSLQMLTPNVVNKLVVFEMIYHANNYLLDYFVFKCFFRFCLTGDKCTFLVPQRGHVVACMRLSVDSPLWIQPQPKDIVVSSHVPT